MTDFDRHGATDIASAVGSGVLDPREVIDECLNAIECWESAMHAWVRIDRDGAMRQAEDVAQRVRQGARLPLAGVPFGVKDVIDVAGLPTEAGFKPYADRVAATDAYIVARLRELGAIPLGKTHTTQFALADPAPTRNPFNLDYTPGGSSSGSGASVGARTVPFALGTQTGGSVLRPASYCGAVGFKPSFNWISCAGVIPLAWSLDHLGLIARDVTETRLIFDALTNGRASQQIVSPHPRIGLLSQFFTEADPDIAATVKHAADRLADSGAEIEEINLPVDLELLHAVHRVIMEAEMAAVHIDQLAEHRDDYGPLLATEVDAAQLIPATYVIKARRLRGKLCRTVDASLAQFDAWLLPTVSIDPPLFSAGWTGDPSFQAYWTLLGTPSITLPVGLSEAGLPVGLQLVGGRRNDQSLLAIASWAESIIGRVDPPAREG